MLWNEFFYENKNAWAISGHADMILNNIHFSQNTDNYHQNGKKLCR